MSVKVFLWTSHIRCKFSKRKVFMLPQYTSVDISLLVIRRDHFQSVLIMDFFLLEINGKPAGILRKVEIGSDIELALALR